jgi:hypothetical protein
MQDVVDEINPSSNDLITCFDESDPAEFDSDYTPSGFDPHATDKTGYELLYFRNYAGWEFVGNAGWNQRRSFGHAYDEAEGRLVVVGGYDGNYLRDTWYSTDNGQTWIQNTSTDFSEREHFKIVSDGGAIILTGGNNVSYLSELWYTATEGADWLKPSPQPPWMGRSHHSYDEKGSINTTYYSFVIGGYDGGQYLNDVWMCEGLSTWTKKKDNNTNGFSKRMEHEVVVMPNGDLILMGGVDANGRRNDVWKSTDDGATWSEIKRNNDDGFSKRSAHEAVVNENGVIFVMGGVDDNNQRLNDIWVSTDGGYKWDLIGKAKWDPRNNFGAEIIGNYIYVFGGDGNTQNFNDIWRLDISNY